jgi:hypothetical protein
LSLFALGQLENPKLLQIAARHDQSPWFLCELHG